MNKKRLQKEQEQLMLDLMQLSDKTTTRIHSLLDYSMENITKEIEDIYYKYKERYGLSDEEMLKLMSEKLTPYEIKQYVDKGIFSMADAMSLQNNITRLTVLKSYIGSQMQYVEHLSKSYLEELLITVVDTTRARNIFNISKEIGFELEYNKMPKAKMDKLLHHQWMDSNFYKRIQHNCGALQDQVEKVLTDGVLRGKPISYMAQQIEQTTNYGKVASTRLVRTETAHFHNKVEGEQYEELGIEKYMIVATLDGRTCSKAHGDKKSCGELDGKVFKVSDRKEGVNYPIFHVNCRCTTVVYIDDETRANLQRRARTKDGKSIVLDKYMSYEDWYKKYN